MKTINITNGEWFNKYFEKTYNQHGIPFNEAMMSGVAPEPIYDDDFIRIRAAENNVTVSEYEEKMALFGDFIRNTSQYEKVVLWFGADCFCRMNMITVLALMENAGCKAKVYSAVTDDESFEIKQQPQPVYLGTWREIYRNVLQMKRRIYFGDAILDNAVEMYLDYLAPDGRFARYIKENPYKSDEELLVDIINMSADYGLSDIQIKALIKKYREQ
ncbi:MAG: hypothetical protein E7588_00530 [Ruminococcaceae bacterium]|nr:hypothetical protein [Oscillospiraceae bacterium]